MTKLWSEDVEHPSIITRYSRNGIPYQVNHERYAPSGGERMRNGFRGYSMSAHETQQNEQDTEEGQKPQHRRRIPVACGRCRKRKIKCSGPIGDDGCHNCKLAGTNDNCQFNRVQSEELPFVKDNFSYDSSAALRTLHRNRGFPCYNAVYGTPSMGNTLGSQQPYRQLPLNEYQYPTKATYYTAPYGIDYTDDGVDYSIMPHTYPQLNQDQIGLQYAPNPPARPWTPAPGLKAAGNAAACYDPDPSCAYTSAPPLFYNHNASYASRSSISTESSNFSFHNMANSLPATSTLTSNERVLPVPARPLTRTSDGVLYSNSSAPTSGSGIKIMDNETPLSLSSDGTSHSYSSTDNTGEQDLYGGTSNGWTTTHGHQPSLRSQNSQTELFSYGTTSDNIPSRKLQMDTAGTLCDGNVYVPYTSVSSGREDQALSDDQDHLHEPTLHRETISNVVA
ncbi:hypothetical protein O988_06430 [Pseudogymnoascus sp. VKM F-3808]|nr:hypothetical protein O988_06430 [Pseudogymnoascus sp. VKM F-3808]